MSTAQTIKDNLQSLIDAAGTTTGKTYTNMTSATTALIEGYGQGGGGGTTPRETIAESISPIDITTDERFTLPDGLAWQPRGVYGVGDYDAYTSVNIGDSASTTQVVQIQCPQTTAFALAYACTSEGDCDPFSLKMNDTLLISKYSENSTTQYTWNFYIFTLNKNEDVTFSFKYEKDGSVAKGKDSAGFMFFEIGVVQ